MKVVACPHCGNRRIAASRVPKDVVVVLPCPACHELVVLFRHKVAALNRDILETGTFEQRKAHIAEIVMEFLEPGMFPFHAMEMPHPEAPHAEMDFDDDEDDDDDEDFMEEPAPTAPITQREVDRFVKLELQQIDKAAYFKKHFG
jgi:predicted RNA-binding Zn-ribbon protein involved in translation (DUF1610 family)